MIKIQKSKTADTRTCSFSQVSKNQLRDSSVQHIRDVAQGMSFFSQMIKEAAEKHDNDKLSGLDHFHNDFITGFAQTGWWDNHRATTRHHLLAPDGVPEGVNLIDILEMIVDCVMAGMGRSGSVYPLDISPDVLMTAFNNTAELLRGQIVVEEGKSNE